VRVVAGWEPASHRHALDAGGAGEQPEPPVQHPGDRLRPVQGSQPHGVVEQHRQVVPVDRQGPDAGDQAGPFWLVGQRAGGSRHAPLAEGGLEPGVGGTAGGVLEDGSEAGERSDVVLRIGDGLVGRGTVEVAAAQHADQDLLGWGLQVGVDGSPATRQRRDGHSCRSHGTSMRHSPSSAPSSIYC
jgi:hypothetical protein